MESFVDDAIQQPTKSTTGSLSRLRCPVVVRADAGAFCKEIERERIGG
jgi:hypothetical protein